MKLGNWINKNKLNNSSNNNKLNIYLYTSFINKKYKLVLTQRKRKHDILWMVSLKYTNFKNKSLVKHINIKISNIISTISKEHIQYNW